MSTGPENVSRRRRLARLAKTTIVVVAATALAVPVAGWASHQFSDVPDSNKFHADIEWMKQTGVTAGCGGTEFCPSDVVTREQMSAFMARLETKNVFLRANGKAKDAAALGGNPAALHLRGSQGHVAYGWVCDSPGTATSMSACSASWFNSTGGDNTYRSQGTGAYEVRLENMWDGAGSLGLPTVTPYASSPRICTITGWGPLGSDVAVYIRCFDTSGNLTNTRFNISYLS